MAQITFDVPEQMLELATTKAQELGKSLDELCIEAIDRYIRVTKHASPGSVRSRYLIPPSSPEITIEVSEDLLEQANEAAERQEKRPPMFFMDALAYQLTKLVGPGTSAIDWGHTLPANAMQTRTRRSS